MSTSVLKTPEVYVDSVIFQLIDDELAVLLTQREQNPFKGHWALPGGLDPIEVTTYDFMQQILAAKTNVKVSQLGFIEQLYTFDTIVGNPMGPAVSVVYMGLGKNITPKATASSRHSQFFSVKALPQLAFDHNTIVDYAHQRLKSKLSYTNAIFALLPELFTLSQLQTAYEAVLEQSLDKRNFRKKFLSFGLIHPTTEYLRNGAHRPAQLYRFNNQTLEYLSRSFD